MLLVSELCWHDISEECQFVSEPLSCVLKVEIPRKENVWFWMLVTEKNEGFLLTSSVGKWEARPPLPLTTL